MIGGDLKVAQYRYRARPQNKQFVLFPANQYGNHLSFFSAIVLLSKISLDTDPFFFYEDMNTCGLIEALIITIIIVILIQFSIHIYIRCWFYDTAYNYENIWTCVFGSSTFNFIPIILNVLAYLTYVVWCTFEIHDNAATFINTVWPSCPSFITNKWFLSYIINFLTAFPCLFARNFASLAWIAYTGNIAMLISIICLVILLIRNINELGFDVTVKTVDDAFKEDELRYRPFISLFSKDTSSLFHCAGSVMTAFYMHPMLDKVFSHMENPTVFRCISCAWIVGIVSIVVYYGAGLLSYFIVQANFQNILSVKKNQKGKKPFNIFTLFYGSILDLDNENVFYNYDTKHIEAIIGQIASYVITITTNSIYHYFLASQVASLVINRKQDDTPPLLIAGFVTILFCIGMNFLDDSATDILDLISIIAFCILVFLLPSIFYLKLYRFTNRFWGVISCTILIIGIIVSILVVYFNADAMF